MIDVLDSIVSLFAPHSCFLCGDEPDALCLDCSEHLRIAPSTCAQCGVLTDSFATCGRCRKTQPCEVIFARTTWGNLSKRLVYSAKYERSVGLHTVIAREINSVLPGYMPGFVVSYVPTSNNHIRARGYDHSLRISRFIAKQRNTGHTTLLARVGRGSQVGHTRAERAEQLKGAFRFVGKGPVPHKVLLIDDVKTTGATLAECARTLKRAGVKHVYAAVFTKV